MVGAAHGLPLLFAEAWLIAIRCVFGLHREFEMQGGANGQQLGQADGGGIQLHGRHAALGQVQPLG